jgi:iron complex outermembrane receptor protein
MKFILSAMVGATLALSAIEAGAQATPGERQVSLTIESTSLAIALDKWAQQSGFQIFVQDWEDAKRLTAPSLMGTFSAQAALEQLLKGTQLTYVWLNDRAVSIRKRVPPTVPTALQSSGALERVEVPQLQLAPLAAEGGVQGGGARGAQAGRGHVDGPEIEDLEELEEIVVTGSRLLRSSAGAAPVVLYDRKQIERSGHPTLNEFLNSLPSVSVAMNSFASRTYVGAATIQLHGLPMGTTLVLVNGRRVGPSSGQSSVGYEIFDLNSIPLEAVKRVEVLSAGSSAVYGSDAIAGVVNIVLNDDLDGLTVRANYGTAAGTDRSGAGLTWGTRSSNYSVSITASYQKETELGGTERSITADNDYSRFGGADTRLPFYCSPGNVYSVDGVSPLPGLGDATFAAVPTSLTGVATTSDFEPTAGLENTCDIAALLSRIPESERTGLFAHGTYAISNETELFAEFMYSKNEVRETAVYASMFGTHGFQSFTVSEANPYNPFGVRVGIGRSIPELQRQASEFPLTLVRPLIGLRGRLGASWDWELAGWGAEDKSTLRISPVLDPVAVQNALDSSDPNTALNPFIDGVLGPASAISGLLGPDSTLESRGRRFTANGFIRGTVAHLPTGPLQAVLGAEYVDDSLKVTDPNQLVALGGEQVEFRRKGHAEFAELRVPVIGARSSEIDDARLVLTAAARYDYDELFGGETTPQFGLEWRPSASWLLRGTYGDAFKAPNLVALFRPTAETTTFVTDPRNGGELYATSESFGGNPDLKPETGRSQTLGIVYSSDIMRGLQISATHWDVHQEDAIQSIPAQTIVDNEDLFPGRVVRDGSGAISLVDSTSVNFGEIDVRGVDYQIRWEHEAGWWRLQPSLSATQTYHYTTALLPGLVKEDRVSRATQDYNFAPRWKASAALNWSAGPYDVNLSSRYVGAYRDYLPLTSGEYRTLGKFALFDINVRLDVTQMLSSSMPWGASSSVDVGAINALDKLPQFSNNIGFGFDGTQQDIRGRFVYARVSVKW